MEYRVQIYCEGQEGVPAPLPPQTVVADDDEAAVGSLVSGKLLRRGPHGKLAATVWRSRAPNPKRASFYRP